MDSLVTIIIPAYNAAKYLPSCLEYVYAQTKAARVLIANDGSTDETAAIADTAEKVRPELVRALQLPYLGLSGTRQAAIAAVETRYFAFLDVDDALEPTFVEEMLDAAIQHDADLVFCPYTCMYDGVARHVSYGGDGNAYSQAEKPLRKNPELLLGMPTFFWGKLFRTGYFRPRLEFPKEECEVLEDVVTLVPLLLNTPRIAKVDSPLYRYTIAANSLARIRKRELDRLAPLRLLEQRLIAMNLLPQLLPQLYAINRCHLFDQLGKLCRYCDPAHQHRVVREYFRHLDGTLPGWRPHPFHPTFYAAYWHGVVAWNAMKRRLLNKEGTKENKG